MTLRNHLLAGNLTGGFPSRWLGRVFFFFQAEDGIRDLTVTGVQTCALPISSTTTSIAARSSGVATAPGIRCRSTQSLSIRIADALNSAVPDFGSVASIVSRLDRKSVV